MFTGSRILPPHPRRNHNSAPRLSAGERLTRAGRSPAAFITPPARPRPTAGRDNEANICGEDTFCKERPPRTPPLKTVGSFCRSRHRHRSFSLEKRRFHCPFPQNNTQVGATTGRPYHKNRKNGQTYRAPAVCPGKLFDWSEKPFVCLMYFRIRENTFTLSSRKTIVRPYLRQPLLNLCTRDKRESERIGGTKRGALVPHRQPSPRSVVFRRRPENKVFRLVARQNPFTEGVLAAPPVPLKVKATDTAHIYPMKSQYRLPIKII